MKTDRDRRAHRWGLEPLESRVAMSRTPGFGALGDSLTDEYRFYPPDRSHARNWVETLAATGQVNFGTYSTKDRGLPRSQGYRDNWAKQDATSTDVVNDQLAGLAHQVGTGTVKFAAVGMGTNDFLFFAESVATATLAGDPPASSDFAAELTAVEATAIANFDRTVATLLAANGNARVIVQTTPDIRQVPLVAQYLSVPGASQAADAIAAAQSLYNEHIREVAATTPRVALADIAAQAGAFSGSSATTLKIGGTTLNLTTTGDDYHDAVLADKIHPGTIAQGLIVDAVVEAADTLGAKINPLTPTEIVSRAKYVADHYRTAR